MSLEDARERGELQRAYYTLLHIMAHTGLSGALLKMPQPGVLDAAIEAVTQGASAHVDASVRRTCMQVWVWVWVWVWVCRGREAMHARRGRAREQGMRTLLGGG